MTELVIKIPEEVYRYAKKYNVSSVLALREMGMCMNAIANGTPLPKGHGRLIDADKYRKDMQESREFNFFATLDFQQTIIEADRG